MCGGEQGELVAQRQPPVGPADQGQDERVDLLGPAQAVRHGQHLPVHRPALVAHGGLLPQLEALGGPEAGGEQPVGVAGAQPVLAVEPRVDPVAERRLHPLAQVLHPHDRVVVARAAQRDDAEADRLHLVRVEPVQPVRHPARVGRLADIGEPQVDVRHRVGHLTLDDPGVQPRAGEPAGHPLAPVLPGDVHPVGQVLHGAALGEQARRGGGQFRADRVADPPRVAVDVRGGAGAHHERRVAHHQVEAPPGDGGDHVTAEEFPVLAVERGGGGGEAQRPRRQVGGGDPPRVAGQVQGLHAGPGAQVQRGLDGPADGRADQRLRRPADAEHVLGVQRAAGPGTGGHVGEHPPLVPVRLQVHAHPQPVAVPLDQAPGERLGQRQRRQRGGHGGLRLGLLADEHPDQGAERVAVLGGAQRGPEVVAGHPAGGLRAEPGGDAVRGEPGPRQRGP